MIQGQGSSCTNREPCARPKGHNRGTLRLDCAEMNFYTRVLTKLGVGERLKLTVSVEYKFEDAATKQKIDDVKGALRELGLNDRLEEL